jgi:hypothetical protein
MAMSAEALLRVSKSGRMFVDPGLETRWTREA